MILNSLSDATSTDGTKSASAQARLQEDLNRFLNLLVTQLKNQDPLDPLDANEFTSQLVQFASVEQQIYQNANLEKLLALQQTSQISSMVDFIGHTAEATGKKVPLENKKAEFTYTLDANSAETLINIKNGSGITVFTGDGETDVGKHTFTWDGVSLGTMPQPEGVYTVSVTAFDPLRNLQDVKQTVYGRVTGSGAEDGKVSLFFGDIKVPMDDVLSVKETPTPVP
jgi:flagellar basal-body rod modification protein FlgD